jgi:hypothetical protein
MDNLHAEKFAIGGNDATFSYDGSGINPTEEVATPMEELSDAQTFENEPIDKPQGEEAEISTETKAELPNMDSDTDSDTDGTFKNLLVLGAVLFGLFIYSKKK